MRLPAIQGIIRRRILVNFRVDPEVIQAQLPTSFRPKLQNGQAVAGICLIRMETVRPRRVPSAFGVSSENAAHRVAVLWDADGVESEGVFVPRRDTGSALNYLAGGRLFPGVQNRASFEVRETADTIDFGMQSEDGLVAVRVRGSVGGELPASSSFKSVAEASDFFEPGSIGYSVTHDPSRLDGIELRTHGWHVEPLQVDEVYSSWFADETKFPRGTVEFDCALVMRNLAHEWHGVEDMHV